MNSNEIRSRFLEFFEKRGHAKVESAPLVTTDEKGVTNATLFNTAGMQPLVPYLLGKPHQAGKRLVSIQKCLRTIDIDDVGDNTHGTFFEMLGNWSLGDYFKKEAINWSYEFLTSKSDTPGDRGLGLDPNRLYVTVFEGDANAPRDNEAAQIWRDVFEKNSIDAGGDTTKGEPGRIYFLPAAKNWWEAGDNGPCGPDTEMHYDVGDQKTGKPFWGGKPITKEQYIQADKALEIVEVWNDVFMQYEKKDGKIVGNLPAPSVDTGSGLERQSMTSQGVDNIYDTDFYKPIMEVIKNSSKTWLLRSARIVADHVRAATFLIGDGVLPSNTDRGYILRKLIRRAVRHADIIGLTDNGHLDIVAQKIIETYQSIYPEIGIHKEDILTEITKEETKFRETLRLGIKEFENGVDAFTLFSSYGFPLELTMELALEKGTKIDVDDFNEKFKAHQALSRAGAEQKFKGGLADSSDPMVIRYHTATHLLHQALHDILGDGVEQKGSNITKDRLRFDFAAPSKMTDEQKNRVESIVNSKIASALPVHKIVLPRAEAEKTGARHFFAEKYGDMVSIYFVGDDMNTAYSKEFCGGPHVENTSQLSGPDGKWRFKIQKEEAVSAGVRRIKAILA